MIARHRRQVDGGERGSVLVEFAIVVLFLTTAAFGTIEYGYGWNGAMTVLTAARAGARSLASTGTDVQSDYYALTSIRTYLDSEDLLTSLQKVVIYRADAANGDVPQRCVSGTPQSTDLCNIYTGTQVTNVATLTFSTTTGCMTATGTKNYCPNARKTAQGSADSIGVWVQVRQKTLTSFFGAQGILTSRDAVMRMEPA